MPRGVFERGEKPPSPYERLSETELREAAGSELDALREAPAGGVPDGPARAGRGVPGTGGAIGPYGPGHEGRSGSGERLAAIVL